MPVSKHRKKHNYFTAKHTHIAKNKKENKSLTLKELEQINKEIGELILLHSAFLPNNKTPLGIKYSQFTDHLPNPDEVSKRITLLAKDLAEVVPKYNQLGQEQLDFENKGSVSKEEREVFVVETSTKYFELIELINNLLTPTFTYILDQYRIAEEKYNKIHGMENDVEDIELK